MTAKGPRVCELYASTTPGLEEPLQREVRSTQPIVGPVVAESGGVSWTAQEGGYEDANLKLRIATKVWMTIARASRPADLKRVGTHLYVRPGSGFAYKVIGKGGTQFADSARRLWPLDEGPEAQHMLVKVEGESAVVAVDTSGELLHRRGYRTEVGRAPMRETLAAGVLALAGYDGQMPLVDLMCGSGTMAIEAACRAVGRWPGAGRSFAFERWPSHHPARWHAKQTASARAPSVGMLTAYDLNAGALGVARRNAERAGVAHAIRLLRADVTQLKAEDIEALPGVVVANLPYGKRIGEGLPLVDLAEALAAMLRRAFAGWKFAFLMSESLGPPAGVPVGAKWYGLPISQVHRVDNGGLSCVVATGVVSNA